MGKQVDRRRAVELEILLPHFHIRWQYPAEMETQADFVRLYCRQPFGNAMDVHETEGLREAEVFLQNAVAGVCVLWVRQQRFVIAEAYRLQQ